MALMVSLGPGPCGRDGGSAGICQLSAPLGPALRTTLRAALGGTQPSAPRVPVWWGLPGWPCCVQRVLGWHTLGEAGGKPHGQFPGQDLSNAAAAGDLSHLAGGSSCCQDGMEPQGQSG